jgi:hypothetical protein
VRRVRCVFACCKMECGEASCAKRARLLFLNQNDTDSDSDDA